MSFPTSLDTFVTPNSTDKLNSPSHSGIESAQNTALTAVEAKVGINSSAVTSTLDYKLTNVASQNPGHSHTPSVVGLSNVTNEAQIPKSIGSVKGDIIAFTGGSTPVRLGVGSDNQVLTAASGQTTGLQWTTLSSARLNTSPTAVTVSNSNAVNPLFTFSVPGGTLGTNSAIVGKLFISNLRIGGSTSMAINLKYGSTTLATVTLTNSADTGQVNGSIDFNLIANTSTSAQVGNISAFFGNSAFATIKTVAGAVTGTASEDSTGALNLIVSVQFAGTSANDTITMNGYTLTNLH